MIIENSPHEVSHELYQEYADIGIRMIGSWQTADHFLAVRDELKHWVAPQFTFSSEGDVYRNQISHANCPVSVHVRRGDFLKINHGVHTAEYYRAASELIRKQTATDPNWFVFSEDQAWCRSNLSFLGTGAQFIELKGAHAEVEELLLMKECHAGAIIANSSFSWWGAALGDRHDRPVVASRYRHGPGKGDLQAQRLLPHWQTIEEF